MFGWLRRIKKPEKDITVSLQRVQAMCDTQRPLLRKEDLDRINETHQALQDDISATKDQAKQIATQLSSELERAKIRVSIISDSLMDPLISLDANGIIVSTNQTAERILGFTSTDLVGKSVNFLISNSSSDYASIFREEASRYIEYVDTLRPSTLVEYRDLYRNYVLSKVSNFLNVKHSVHCTKRSGGTMPAELYANILNVDCESPDNIIFLAIFRDTSEQKAAQSEVESLTQFQLSLLTALPNPVYYKDSNLKIIGSNRAFDVFINQKSESFIGKTNAELFPQDLAISLDSIDADLKDSSSPDMQLHKLEFQSAMMPESRSVMLYCTALRSKSGEFKGVLATIVDLTEIDSMHRFKDILLSSIPAPVYYLDRDLKYAGCNERYCKLLGMKAEEIVGRSREEVLDFEGKNFGILSEFYRQKDFEMLTAGQTTQSYEAQVYNRTTKKVLDLVVYRSLLTSVGGRFDGILAVATDVSDIRAVQRFHQRIFDSSPLPVYYKDRNLNYVMCNDLYAEWYDLPKSMFIGRNRKDLVQHIKASAAGSEDKLALIEKIEESMKVVINDHETDDINLSACLTSSISVLEHKVWNFKLHEMRDVIFYKHALIGESGFEGIICSMIDVTELRKFEQTRSDLLEALPFAVCSCNEDGNIVECNKLYASMVGLERKDLLGRNIADESIKKFHRFTGKPVYVSDNGRETYVEALGTEVSHNTLVLRTVVEDPGVKISTVFIYFQKGDLYESLAV